jgi:hypothetical protein
MESRTKRIERWTALTCIGALLCGPGIARAEAGDTLARLRQELEHLRQSVAATVQVPVGTIMPFGGDVTNPSTRSDLVKQGWLPCDGALLSASEFRELHGAIGTAFGGSKDTSTFNVPDLRGRFLRGVSEGTKTDPDADARQASAPGGNKGDAVGSVQGDAFQGHQHATNAINGDKEGNWGGGAGSKPKGNAAYVGAPTQLPGPKGSSSAYGPPSISGETRPKNVYVTWIIKAKTLTTSPAISQK